MNKRVLIAYGAYLGTLGICWLAWIPAVAAYFDDGDRRPTFWALAFGLWFLLYAGIWYIYLLLNKRGEQAPNEYGGIAAITDVVDAGCIVAAFICLGLMTQNYSPARFQAVYIIVCVCIVSAAIANARRWKATFDSWRRIVGWPLVTIFLFILSFAIPAVGYFAHLSAHRSTVDADGFLLSLLYLMLAVYFVAPPLFASRRGREGRRHSEHKVTNANGGI